MNLDLFQEIMRDDYGQKMTMYDNSRVFTPEKTAKQMVDMLPDQVWDPKTKFLDPCCKTGVFLIEIYNKLDEALQKLPDYSDKSKRRNHILNNQIFGIALDDESLIYSRRNVAGDIFYENIQYLPQFMRFIKDKDYAGIKKLLKQEEVFKMDKFDVVIGNPPYQENNSTNGRQSKQLYDKFILAGIELTYKFLVYITNNTFFTNDSKKELRDVMIASGLSKLYNYPIQGDIFNEVGVSACIFLIDKSRNNGGGRFEYKRIEHGSITNQYNTELLPGSIIAESKYEISICDKVKSKLNMDSIVLGDKTFGIASSGRVGFNGKGNTVMYDVHYTVGKVKLKNKFADVFDEVYMDRQDVPKGKEYIDLYKVVCPLIVCKQSLSQLDKAFILEPGTICTQNWSVVGVFKDKQDAINLQKYLKTKIYKFITYVFVSNAMTSIQRVLMSHVPLQDFTSNSDIDWSKSIEDIDKQLYRKYNLTQEEIDYIEKTIKPMK